MYYEKSGNKKIWKNGKGDIDGLGGMCKQQLKGKNKLFAIDSQTSLESANCASKSWNIIHYLTDLVENGNLL